MKTHTTLGYDSLKHSERRLLKAGAIIALQHHEKWEGGGYPQGIKAEEVHLYGRITGIADVFDALSTDRVYKPAWEMDRIVSLFKAEAGHHFDPRLVKAFLDNIDQFTEVMQRLRDSGPDEALTTAKT